MSEHEEVGCAGLNVLHCVARIEEALGASHRKQNMLLYSQFAESTKIASIPSEVCMCISKAGHERAAFAVEYANPRVLLQFFDVWHSANGGYPFTCLRLVTCSHASTRLTCQA
jgi:hypothetical protein